MTARLPTAPPMCPVPFPITEVRRNTRDCFTLVLEPPEGTFPFEPGQFNMLYAFGKGEVPISISGDPDQSETLVHTIRAVGSVTGALADLEEGDAVGVRGPFGTSWPLEQAEGDDLLIIAGGIGIAPLRPAIHRALARRDRYERILILVGTRTPRDIVFDDQLMDWRRRFDLEVQVTVDVGDERWKGKTGVVTRLVERAEFDAENATALLCGPEIMMRFVARELGYHGMSAERIRVTLERNMQCAIAHCGHCQMGPELICRDGPVYRYDHVSRLLGIREI